MAERPIYESLADAAHRAGFEDETPSQVHRWVRAGLLPRTADQISIGRRGFVSVPRSAAVDQLLALCRWRRATKSLSALTVLLWMDGWLVSSDRVRLALHSWLPRASLPRLETDKQREGASWELSELARKFTPTLRRKFGARHLSPDDMADAADFVLQAALGLSAGEVTHEQAVAIERLSGLDRARTDRAEGVEPWLTTPPEQSLELLAEFSFSALARMTETVSDEELAGARPRLRFFVRTGPAIADAAEAYGGLEFGALHGLRIRPRQAVWGLTLLLHLARQGLGNNMDELVRALEQPRAVT